MRVFKYRGGSEALIRRDIRTLFQNQIYAAPVESLNDLFEARVTIQGKTFRLGLLMGLVGLQAYTERARVAEDKFLAAIDAFAKSVVTWGVYSLSRSAADEVLWAHYADSHQGFCLEYELDELLEYKLRGQHWTTVDYKDQPPVITLDDVIALEKSRDVLIRKFIGTKSTRWAYESEVRVVTGKSGVFEYDFRALKAVYFGARSTPHLRRRVMRAMAGRGLKYFELTSNGGTYELRASPIADAFAREADYRKRVAPVEVGVPYLDAKTTPHERDLMKAIEIARREPYCERVTDAYISSRGSLDDPVFYVTYDRSDGVPQNFFISKRELDIAE